MATTNMISAAGAVAHATKYNTSIGYLRAFIVVLVVAHHAVLAYHPFAPPPAASLVTQPRWWGAFPVVDSHRWTGFVLFAGFNDVFFMSLLFFLSGLFVWNGLQRKGITKFLRDRLLRLGLPFVASAAIAAPLAYYPAFLQMTGHSDFAGFLRQWLSLGQWPAGPAWFIWVLLVFDCIAALCFVAAPKWGEALGRIISRASRRPVVFLALLVAVSALAYVPMALIFTPFDWTAFGPFTFQTSRILHYLAYFLTGVGAGALGFEHGLFAPNGRLARRWLLWAMAALVVFGIGTVFTVVAATAHPQSRTWSAAMDLAFVVSCATTGVAFLALFVRFASSPTRLWDSLSSNSYGIYLVHYAFVSWLQYAFLPASLPPVAKGAVVFVGALTLSWVTAAAMRRIPAVARVV